MKLLHNHKLQITTTTTNYFIFCTTTNYLETLFRHNQAHKAGIEIRVYFHVTHRNTQTDSLTHHGFRNQISPSAGYSFISLRIPFVAPENLAGIITCVSLSTTYHSTAVCPTTPGAAQKIVRQPLSKEHALLLMTCNPRSSPICQIFCLHFPQRSERLKKKKHF